MAHIHQHGRQAENGPIVQCPRCTPLHTAIEQQQAELVQLRRIVAAVRSLCDEAEQDEPSAVFSQGGAVWGVWTEDVRRALEDAE